MPVHFTDHRLINTLAGPRILKRPAHAHSHTLTGDVLSRRACSTCGERYHIRVAGRSP